MYFLDFPDGTVDKNQPANAGDAGSIPGLETRIVCVAGQLSSQAARREKPMYHKERSCMPQLRPEAARTKVNK